MKNGMIIPTQTRSLVETVDVLGHDKVYFVMRHQECEGPVRQGWHRLIEIDNRRI
jgi:hypothetical protein